VPLAGVATVIGIVGVAISLVSGAAAAVAFDAVWPVLIALRAVAARVAAAPADAAAPARAFRDPRRRPMGRCGRRGAGRPRFGARALLFRMSGVDLTQIEGISETTALVILSELGIDLSAFPHEKNFVSWLGLCPQHRGSGGKIFKRRIRRGANRVARALRMAAQGCHHAHNALGAFYRRIQGRSGGGKAIVATARKIAERVYRMLKFGQEYVRQSEAAYEQAYELRLVKSLAKRAAKLGYQLVPETAGS